jgi:uncharacterized OB-fold protein
MSDETVKWYTERFWNALADGEFLVGQCADCEEAHFPPGPVCPHCGGTADTTESEGTGTLYSFTKQRRTAPDFDAPIVMGMVTLSEGPRVLMRLEAPYDELQIGQSVEVVTTEYDADYDRGRLSDYPMFAAEPV